VEGGANLFRRKKGKPEVTFFFLSDLQAIWKKEKRPFHKKGLGLLLLLFVFSAANPIYSALVQDIFQEEKKNL
jgi:hypothetical protein